MKTSFYFSQYFNGKRGLRLYEFHNGKVSLVEHDGVEGVLINLNLMRAYKFIEVYKIRTN